MRYFFALLNIQWLLFAALALAMIGWHFFPNTPVVYGNCQDFGLICFKETK